MRLRVSALLLALAAPALAGTYAIAGDPGPWPAMLSAAGLVPAPAATARLVVVRQGATPVQVSPGAILLLEGDSPAARALGFLPTNKRVTVRSAIEQANPRLDVVWEHSLELPVTQLPPAATVFTRERWQGAPLVAGLRNASGAVLWLAAPPGASGHERFPYLLQALTSLGLEPGFGARDLWVFFDSSYRRRVDLEYFGPRWRAAGISALHVAAWHFHEPDAANDAWLRQLIEVSHRNAIRVYAWLELPHVSERFWRERPECREQTAVGQDAHLDWRRLINLANPACAAAVETGVSAVVRRFDWDGVNLAELYFESLEGYLNAARFTPLNADVRREFGAKHGFDPLELFRPDSPRHPSRDAAPMRAFLEYRSDLARRLQEHWIGRLEDERKLKPGLDLVLTHVDDRFDTTMRDKIGADAARLIPFTERRGITFLVEDPATVWHLGPGRYAEIGRRYAPLARQPELLAIDINVVERYQDVYPTKQQTGVELLQLVHVAARAFTQVALYFESSLLKTDLPLLSAAQAVVESARFSPGQVEVDAPRGVGVNWDGAALVNGKLWPAAGAGRLWLPAGRTKITAAPRPAPLKLLDLNARLLDAAALEKGLTFRYRSAGRAYAVLERKPARLWHNGKPAAVECLEVRAGCVLVLPHGEHLVRAEID